MKKSFVLIILCVSAMLLMASCGKSGEDQLLDYRFADHQEGAELMLGNEAYYDGFSQNELDYKMQKKDATMEEYQAFEKKGDRFFDTGVTALVPVDGSDRYWLAEDASNFDEIFGTNTGYVIDPEECMADNFSYCIAYGKEGPDGEGYPNPEIIQVIEDELKK